MKKLTAEDINKLRLPFFDRVDDFEGVRVLRFKGPIDSTTLPELAKIREAVVRTEGLRNINILVDMKKVTHVDSASVATFMLRMSELKERNQRIGLINVPAEAKAMLDVFKAGQDVIVYPSEEEALKDLQK